MSNEYLQAFRSDRIEIITDPIEEFTKDGIKAGGKVEKFDKIIYCTGFTLLKSLEWFDLYGRNSTQSQKEEVGDCPMQYLGMTNRNYPNYFRMIGANTILAHSSVIFMIECQADYITKALDGFLRSHNGQGAKTIELKQKSLEKYYADIIQPGMKKMNYSEENSGAGCGGWYRNSRGINWTIWPKTTTNYWWHTCCVDFDQYELKR